MKHPDICVYNDRGELVAMVPDTETYPETYDEVQNDIGLVGLFDEDETPAEPVVSAVVNGSKDKNRETKK